MYSPGTDLAVPDYAETPNSSASGTLRIHNTLNPPEMLLLCSAQCPAQRQRSISSCIKVHVFQWLLAKESSPLTFSLCREYATSVKVEMDSSLFLRSMKMSPESQHARPKVPIYRISFFAMGTQRLGNISIITGRGQEEQNKLSSARRFPPDSGLQPSALGDAMPTALMQLHRIRNMVAQGFWGSPDQPFRGGLLLTPNESSYDTSVVKRYSHSQSLGKDEADLG